MQSLSGNLLLSCAGWSFLQGCVSSGALQSTLLISNDLSYPLFRRLSLKTSFAFVNYTAFRVTIYPLHPSSPKMLLNVFISAFICALHSLVVVAKTSSNQCMSPSNLSDTTSLI